MPAVDVEEALVAYLAAQSSLIAMLATPASGSGIYPLLVPQAPGGNADAYYPAITYQLISRGVVHSLTGASGLSFDRIQVNVWARSYLTAKNIADELDNLLDGAIWTSGSVNVTQCLNVGTRDLPVDAEPGLETARTYGRSNDYMIGWNKPQPTFS